MGMALEPSVPSRRDKCARILSIPLHASARVFDVLGTTHYCARGQRYAVGASSYLDGAASSIRPNGVADDPVHDRVVVDGGAGPQASSRLEALRAEHRQARGA